MPVGAQPPSCWFGRPLGRRAKVSQHCPKQTFPAGPMLRQDGPFRCPDPPPPPPSYLWHHGQNDIMGAREEKGGGAFAECGYSPLYGETFAGRPATGGMKVVGAQKHQIRLLAPVPMRVDGDGPVPPTLRGLRAIRKLRETCARGRGGGGTEHRSTARSIKWVEKEALNEGSQLFKVAPSVVRPSLCERVFRRCGSVGICFVYAISSGNVHSDLS